MIVTYILLIIVVVFLILVITDTLKNEKAFKIWVLIVLALELLTHTGWINLK